VFLTGVGKDRDYDFNQLKDIIIEKNKGDLTYKDVI